MANIRLFNIRNAYQSKEYSGENVQLERELQRVVEKNMKLFFGIDFLCSEYIITDGRIDSLGIDENNCPVIFEYKRSCDDRVISQGLFYMDWMFNHKECFQILVRELCEETRANRINWANTRLICIAGDFTRYDLHAINVLPGNISLIRYKKFGNDLLMFEQVNESTNRTTNNTIRRNTNNQRIDDQRISDFYDNIRDYIFSLGDDVSEIQLETYTAFKRFKNFVCILKLSRSIKLYLSLNPSEMIFEPGFSRDVTNIGHNGTGNVEIVISSKKDIEKAQPFIRKAYNE